MPRPDRIFVEGGVYHVYNRLCRGERVFERDEEARGFVGLLRDVVKRDGLTVFAWCLLPNHYHLAVRTGVVSLHRPFQTLQQKVTRGVNLRQRVFGPLWQGRYKAKLVKDQRYLDQLLVYIHLNPVSAGIVVDPAEYRWSGHREILGGVKEPIVEVDEVLRVFGKTRRSARAAYARQVRGLIEEEWIGEDPGRLPWWRFGRPPKEEGEDPEEAIRERRSREELGPDWRPAIEVGEFVERATGRLGMSLADLRSRRRAEGLARARELLAIVGVERYGLRVKDLAKHLKKTPGGMTQAIARGLRRRASDEGFRTELNRLDRELAEDVEKGSRQ